MKSYDSPGSHSLVIGLLHRKETGLRFPICVYRCSSVVELYCYGEELCVIPTWSGHTARAFPRTLPRGASRQSFGLT